MPRFYTLFLNFNAVNRGFLSQFFLGFLLFFTSTFFKANTIQQTVSSKDQNAVIYVANGTEVFGEINAEMVIINEKSKVVVEPQDKSAIPPKTSLAVQKEEVDEKIKKELANIKPDLDRNFSLPSSQKSRFISPCKRKLFLVQEIQLLKGLGLKSVEIVDKIIIQSPLKILSSYFQFSIISKQNYAFDFTRPPPRGLVI